MSKPLHWLLVGPGALGQLYAGKLALAGHTVSVWSRHGVVPAQDYQWYDLDSQIHLWQSQSTTPPIDVVLVVTKVFQSNQATQAVLESGLVHADCPIILMHNGLGAEANLQRLSVQQPLLLASSRHGALKEGPNRVRHTGQGSTLLGLYQGELSKALQNQLILAFEQALTDSHWQENILEPLWHKLIINSVINPLTARERICNGKILQPQYEQEVHQLCQEACLVAQAEGFPMDSEAMLKQVQQVAQATAQNKSSMLQDVLQHRKTEIDYINGYLIRCAQAHQIPVPAHEQIVGHIYSFNSSSTEQTL